MEINKVYQGDCIELMEKIPDTAIDCIVTSPPYNVGNNNMNYRAKNKYPNKDKDTKEDYFNWLSLRLKEMLRCSRNVFLNIQMLSNNKRDIFKIISEYQDYLKDVIIWGKKNPPPAMETGVMNSCFEFIFIFSKDSPDKRKFYNVDFRGKVNNLIITSVNRNKFASMHKAAFPEEIPRYIIESFTNKGDVVLDPFAGTGTTLIVAKQLDRQYLGFEINPEYVALINKRLEQNNLHHFSNTLLTQPSNEGSLIGDKRKPCEVSQIANIHND